jgi:hypothetical protein
MTNATNANAKAPTREFANSLVQAFLNSGLTITVCPTRKIKPKTFRSSYGAWGRGAKAMTLRNAGISKGRG